MAYSDFDIEILETRFGINFVQTKELLIAESISVSSHLHETMKRNIPLATAINTEKARSELLIAPVFVELKELHPEISLFSGTEFNVDASKGLSDRCDFLISKSPDQIKIREPVAAIVAAKKEDLNSEIPQCAAAMIAAQRFNQRQENAITEIYGIITTGSIWRLLSLRETQIKVDLNEVYLMPLEALLGCLVATLKLEILN